MEGEGSFRRSLRGRRFCVIGGGVVGISLARSLALRGGEVTLLEAGRVGCGASGAAAGVLRPGRGAASLLARLSRAALAGYGVLAAQLGEETGIDVGFRREGFLDLALDEADEVRLRKDMASLTTAGWGARWLERAEARGLVPGSSAEIRSGLFLPEAAAVHPPALLEALRESAARRGVDVREEVTASLRSAGEGIEVLPSAAGDPGRSERALAGHEVIISAGAWTGRLLAQAGLAPAAPIQPVRGQMVEVARSDPPIPVVRHRDVYLVPRPPDAVWVGATVEDAGFDVSTTLEAAESLLRAARAILPDLGPPRRAWAGLRPKLLRRGGPLLGEGMPPVLAGHYRSGILLGPITAHLLSARLAGDACAAALPFHWDGPPP